MSHPHSSKIVAIQGSAFLRLPDGSLSELRPGDILQPNAEVVTSPDGHIELALANGASATLTPHEAILLAQNISAVPGGGASAQSQASSDNSVSPVSDGGASYRSTHASPLGRIGVTDDDGNNFVRVARISEAVGLAELGLEPLVRVVEDTEELTGPEFEQDQTEIAHPLHDKTEAVDHKTPPSIEQEENSPPSININSVTVDEDAGQAIFTVSLSHTIAEDVTFDYGSSDETALAGFDYSAILGSTVISAGSLSTTIAVPIADDYLREGDESYHLTLFNISDNINVAQSNISGLGTITDSGSDGGALGDTPSAGDTIFAIIEGQASIDEGEKGDYIIRLVDVHNNPVTVSNDTEITVVFSNGSAETGDYNAEPQTFVIPAGSNSQPFDVDTNIDIDLDDETFSISIESIEDTGEFEAIDTTSTVTTTIIDHTQPSTQITVASISDPVENEGNDLVHLVTLSATPSSAQTFNCSIVDLTANEGSD
ncbi:MAG: hypothetical protein OET90_01230, partial [Desulfuromonadales bacterium]|nr:hypothetical protein [Desulfuromonadales bacterium]